MLDARSGSTSLQGTRQYMEDRCVCIDDLREALPDLTFCEGYRYAYWAVYDGHAGSRAAEMSTELLHRLIVEDSSFTGNIPGAIQKGLIRTDEMIIAKGAEEGWSEGCCVSMVILMGNSLYAANLGDSHMVLTRNINRYEALLLTETHKAAQPDEKKRISEAGGMVVRNRIFADLAISRALGDRVYKRPEQENNLVSNVAFIEKVSLTQNYDYVILASDGLWDTVSYKEAVDMIYLHREMSPEELSRLLATEALTRGSKDNITVIVVTLNWLSKPNSTPAEAASTSSCSESDLTGENDHGGNKTPASESS